MRATERSLLISDFIRDFALLFPVEKDWSPWKVTQHLPEILESIISSLGSDYRIVDGIAIHETAIIENNVTMKPPVIIGKGCFIGANAYLRHGVYIGQLSTIGPGCEVKTSIIMPGSAIAHFNFVGDSVVGENVNMEAGAVVANHYNERRDKLIKVLHDGKVISTDCEKFGALIGDHCKIGANAVLSPGTLLAKNTVVARLQLVEQVKRPT